MGIKSILILAFVTAITPAALALDLRPAMTIGFEGGGDRVFERSVTTGEKRGFRAGGLAVLGFSADLWHPIGNVNLITRGLFGFKAAGAEAQDGKLDFFRWLVELSEHYRGSEIPFLVGGGITYHFANKLNGTGVLAHLSDEVDTSLGYFVEAGYAFRRAEGRFGLGVEEIQVALRTTWQKYHVADGRNFNANAVGLHFRTVW